MPGKGRLLLYVSDSWIINDKQNIMEAVLSITKQQGYIKDVSQA